ncbi:MAG: invasion protein regulator [Mucilaginibacter sp.]|nr:invasion protein regulator [Mucilaginibacter sp.]
MIEQGLRYSTIKANRGVKITCTALVIACFFFFQQPVFAQSPKKSNGIAIGATRPMTNSDSAMVKSLFFAALREKMSENPSSAAELFSKIIQIDPANDASMYELANLKRLKNNYNEAQQLLEKAVTIKPDNEWYWLALADCYEKSNDLAKLETVFNELIRINPNRPDYFFDKANAYYQQKKYDAALQAYDQLEQLTGPSDDLLANRQKVYLKQGKVDLAAQQLEKMILANPSQIRYYLFLSELYNANNFSDKALKVLLNAEKINANNGLVHLALADIYRDKKNYEACFSELKLAFAVPELDIDQKIKIILGYLPKFPDPDAKASALELSRILTVAHPGDSKAYAVYGDMLLQNNKLKEAKEAYQKSVTLNNQVYEVQEQVVRIELGENDLNSAIKDGESSLSLFPNQAWMNYLVGIAWLQKKDVNKALGYIKNAASLETQDKELLSQSYSSLGDCYHDLKDNKSADNAYDKALGYNPDNVYTLNNYAYYLSLRGEQLDKAARMSKHSNDLQPNNASFEDTYAWILFKQKDYANAKQWIEKAIADDKDNSAVKSEHYGDIMFYLGNVDAAVENWKKAKAHGDQSPALERKINERKYTE